MSPLPEDNPRDAGTRSAGLPASLIALFLAACGGGGGSAATPTPAATPAPTPAPAPTPTASINTALGAPARLLGGLGAGNAISDMTAQNIQPDIVDTYLVGVGSGAWPTWNSPSGAYVPLVSGNDKAIGAIPMFTLYQMAANGDGNLSGINDATFMTSYWAQVKLMYQKIAATGQPTLVNLEPDFWGYVQLQAPGGDPTQLAAQVSFMPECASLPNTAVGIAGCLLTLGRTYAPTAKIGFPASFFGETATSVGNFMAALGASKADYIVAETSDRDAGCFEAGLLPECTGRGTGPFYWDENNVTTPNFNQSLSDWSTVRGLLGNLPILFWQTPMGVPSTTPGGTTGHFRDDHVHYMLMHPTQYTAAGVFAIVFSAGAASQTTITTDGGQFATLFSAYLANPAPYPN